MIIIQPLKEHWKIWVLIVDAIIDYTNMLIEKMYTSERFIRNKTLLKYMYI